MPYYRKPIAIDHTKVLNSDQQDVPVLIVLTDPDLKSTAKGDTMDSGDDWHRHFFPDHPTPLDRVAWRCVRSISRLGDLATATITGHALKTGEIQSSTESTSIAGQYHLTNRLIIHERFTRVGDRVEHVS